MVLREPVLGAVGTTAVPAVVRHTYRLPTHVTRRHCARIGDGSLWGLGFSAVYAEDEAGRDCRSIFARRTRSVVRATLRALPVARTGRTRGGDGRRRHPGANRDPG